MLGGRLGQDIKGCKQRREEQQCQGADNHTPKGSASWQTNSCRIEQWFAEGPTADGSRDPRRCDEEHERGHAASMEDYRALACQETAAELSRNGQCCRRQTKTESLRRTQSRPPQSPSRGQSTRLRRPLSASSSAEIASSDAADSGRGKRENSASFPIAARATVSNSACSGDLFGFLLHRHYGLFARTVRARHRERQLYVDSGRPLCVARRPGRERHLVRGLALIEPS